jgi:hypothetical protein
LISVSFSGNFSRPLPLLFPVRKTDPVVTSFSCFECKLPFIPVFPEHCFAIGSRL